MGIVKQRSTLLVLVVFVLLCVALMSTNLVPKPQPTITVRTTEDKAIPTFTASLTWISGLRPVKFNHLETLDSLESKTADLKSINVRPGEDILVSWNYPTQPMSTWYIIRQDGRVVSDYYVVEGKLKTPLQPGNYTIIVHAAFETSRGDNGDGNFIFKITVIP